MPKVSLVIIMLLQAVTSFAQNYFVFIGADNRQPFYVRVDSEFHSSSAEGHLILSQLKDSNYNITIGFPGQSQPEQHYSFNIDGKDQAFELRSQDSGSLRLYNLQNNQWLSPQGRNVAAGDTGSAGIKKDDAFSRLMAGVVHDTAVLYNTYAMERALSDSPAVTTSQSPAAQPSSTQPSSVQSAAAQSASPDTTGATAAITMSPAPHASPDSATSVISASPASPIPASPALTGVMTHQPAARFIDSAAIAASITKLTEHHTAKNVRLVYADRSGSKKADTIVVVIPLDSPAVAKTAGNPLHTADHPPHTTDSSHNPAPRAHGPNPNADSPVVSLGTTYRPTVPPTAPTEAARPHPADSSHKPGKAIAFINSDCHDFATDFDVDKLRVRMLQSTKDEERIAVARKAFKVKCFYTRQIRALSEVFTSDATKFRFFEAAWPFAADDHFHELSDLLTDPMYNGRFKTMTHQQ